MTANSLLSIVIEKINEEVDSIFSDDENNTLIEDLNLDSIDDSNYNQMSIIILEGLNRLLSDCKPVNTFLLQLLHLLASLNIEEDFDLSTELITKKKKIQTT